MFQAHGDKDDAAVRAAQSAVMERYSGAVYRYLRRVLGSEEAADEVFQEFALKFIRGGYRNADPGTGRFRDYLKMSILNLVTDYRRRHARRRQHEYSAVDDVADENDFDVTFGKSVSEELIGRVWEALQQFENESGQVYYTTLKQRARQHACSSRELAAIVGKQLKPPRTISATAIRKTLQRSREKFAELLVLEVRHLIGCSDFDKVEQELIDLGLHEYCRSALQRRRHAGE